LFPVTSVGQAEIRTQPGSFSLAGDGLCIGRDRVSPVLTDYAAPFLFTGRVIVRVMIDVSSDHYIDHEKEVQVWLMWD
jgi:arylsulfatase